MKNGDTRPKSVLITGATDGLGKRWRCCSPSAAIAYLPRAARRRSARSLTA